MPMHAVRLAVLGFVVALPFTAAAQSNPIAYCDEVYKTMDDTKAAQLVAGAFSGSQAARAQNLIGNTGHFQERYGNLVTCLRINGLVPLSSQR